MKNKNIKWMDVLKALWAVAVIAGGIYYVIKHYASAIGYLEHINLWKLVLAAVIIAAVRLLNVDLIEQSLVLVGWKENFKKTFSFISIAQLGKYIPGGIWQFVGRFEAYKEANITYKNMGKAFIIENVWMVAGSTLVSLAFILFSQPAALAEKYGLHFSNALFIWLGIISLLLWLVTLFLSARIMRPRSERISPKKIARLFISQTLFWVLAGVSFYCLFSQYNSFKDLLFSIGAFGISYLAGYIIIIAPGGIGVREYVAVLLFSLMFTSTEIGIYTIVHRLLYTLIEFLLAGIALLLTRSGKRAAAGEPPGGEIAGNEQ
jgi:glycosyltransferase 2 family protein